jgi:hypothetical protein
MGAIGFGPRLALGPSARAASFDLRSALPPGASFTRASAATRFDANGLLVVEPADAPRFDCRWTGAGWSAAGLLIEPAATNLIARSTAPTDPSWVTTELVSSAGEADLSGGATAAKMTATPITAAHYESPGSSVSFVAGTTYCFSRYVRPGSATRCQIIGTAAAFAANAYLDFLLTEAGSVSANSGFLGSWIEPLAGGWYRVAGAVVANASASGTNSSLIALIDSGGAARLPSIAGAGLNYVTTGAQTEIGARPSSLIVTGAGPGTRAADACSLPWGSVGVPDGARTIRYGFDDGSTQDVATMIAGGMAAVPTNLARSRVAIAQAR